MQVSKYSASGNDFVIFHAFSKQDRSNLAKKLCHRQEGVGADGLIVLLPHQVYDFEWEFYNSDGSVAAMCGNGSRAAALYAYKNSLASKDMSFLTGAGVIEASVDNKKVESKLTKANKLSKSFKQSGKTWHFYDTGVPHLVSEVSDINSSWDEELIKKMRKKYNANVNLVCLEGDTLRVRTYERGVEAETLACGTGMVACFLSLFKMQKVPEKMKVVPKSGEVLQVRSQNDELFFKGEVRHSFDANVYI